jgi:protein-S-isoprenylcysteine O-methyltransferase Ste14
VRNVAKSLAVNAVVLAILLGVSGHPGWLGAWLCVALMAALQLSVVLVIFRKTPDLAKERSKIQPGTKRWDRFLVAGAAVFTPLAMYLVAALDHRFEWSQPLPLWFRLEGFALSALAGLLTFQAMAANRFFSATVRIQSDRGHYVVDSGPYRKIRHPGYTGMIAFHLGIPLLLGSWWALIPAGLSGALFVLRTALEDRTLRAELPGYAGYAARVRKRLLPAIW